MKILIAIEENVIYISHCVNCGKEKSMEQAMFDKPCGECKCPVNLWSSLDKGHIFMYDVTRLRKNFNSVAKTA